MIIGVGGIVGSCLAHFLTELGVRNIVGLEKAGVIPSDIASTAHASDFIFNTSHDKLSNWTTAFADKIGIAVAVYLSVTLSSRILRQVTHSIGAWF